MTRAIGSFSKNNNVANSILTGIHAERTLAQGHHNTRFLGGIRARVNIVYFALFIINVLGYIRFMPR